jgi:hypothetical protein
VISRGGAVHLALRQSAFWRKKNNQWPITDPSSSTGRRRTEDSVENCLGQSVSGASVISRDKVKKKSLTHQVSVDGETAQTEKLKLES